MRDAIDILIIIASMVSIFGVPFLLVYTHRLHIKYLRSVKIFQFEDAEDLLGSVKESHLQVKRELEHELTTAERRVRDNVIGETRSRINYLARASVALGALRDLQAQQYRRALGSYYKKDRGDYLSLLLAKNNARVFDDLESLLVDLNKREEELLSVLGGSQSAD